jgi:hypothetical protein
MDITGQCLASLQAQLSIKEGLTLYTHALNKHSMPFAIVKIFNTQV